MIPVVLIHRGNSERYHLEKVIAQAGSFDNPVTLITESGSPDMYDFWRGATRFALHYKHLSGNHVDFERFCFQRWFVLKELMERKNWDKVLYIDSDVLLYCNVTDQWNTWMKDAEYTLSMGSSPATSCFTIAALSAFCDYMDFIYMKRPNTFDEFERIYKEMQDQKLAGGICDMTLFRYFKQEVLHMRGGEMSEIKQGATWDHNISSPDGFVMKDGTKRVFWEENLPYGQTANPDDGSVVRFNSLHFQGDKKDLLPEYTSYDRG